MLPKEAQPTNPLSKENSQHSGSAQPESNLIKTRSQISALHSFKAQNGPATSHSEMLSVPKDEELVMGKYTVYWVNQKDNDKMYHLAIEWPHVEKVKEAIRDTIPYMNQKIAEDNSNYVLSLDPKQYEFYKAKKSGKAKYDFPSLDMDETLSMTGIQRLTLVEKTPDAVTLRESPNKSQSLDLKTEEPRSTMGNGKLPKIPSIASRKTMEDYEDYYTETVCFCIKVKKRRPRTNPITQVDNLDKKLLQG